MLDPGGRGVNFEQKTNLLLGIPGSRIASTWTELARCTIAHLVLPGPADLDASLSKSPRRGGVAVVVWLVPDLGTCRSYCRCFEKYVFGLPVLWVPGHAKKCYPGPCLRCVFCNPPSTSPTTTTTTTPPSNAPPSSRLTTSKSSPNPHDIPIHPLARTTVECMKYNMCKMLIRAASVCSHQSMFARRTTRSALLSTCAREMDKICSFRSRFGLL